MIDCLLKNKHVRDDVVTLNVLPYNYRQASEAYNALVPRMIKNKESNRAARDAYRVWANNTINFVALPIQENYSDESIITDGFLTSSTNK